MSSARSVVIQLNNKVSEINHKNVEQKPTIRHHWKIRMWRRKNTKQHFYIPIVLANLVKDGNSLIVQSLWSLPNKTKLKFEQSLLKLLLWTKGQSSQCLGSIVPSAMCIFAFDDMVTAWWQILPWPESRQAVTTGSTLLRDDCKTPEEVIWSRKEGHFRRSRCLVHKGNYWRWKRIL